MDVVRKSIEAAGGALLPEQRVMPLAEGDAVIEVQGPADFASRMKEQPAVKAVYASSQMQAY